MSTLAHDLQSSTAAVPPRPGSNEYRDIPDIDTALPIAIKAFEHKTEANKRNGKAVQGMAYAIMVCYFNWVLKPPSDDASVTCPTMADVLAPNKADAKALLKEWLVAYLLGEKEDTKGWPDDERSATERVWSNKIMLLTRALNMAAILVVSDVDCSMFNHKAYAFEVMPWMLYEEGQQPLGKLAKDKELVLLDLRQYAVSTTNKAGGSTFTKITASVDQLNKAMRNRKGYKSSRPNSKSLKLPDIKPVRLATECTLATLIEALHTALEIKGRDKAKPMKPQELKPEIWGKLADIAWTNDQYADTDVMMAYIRNGVTDQATHVPAPATDADTDTTDAEPATGTNG